MEIWKDIINYENKYSVSNYGNIFSKNSNKFLKLNLNQRGYYHVSIGRHNSQLVHRLVAKHFCKKYVENIIVDHIDNNKTNNYYLNLRCITQSQNVINSFETQPERMHIKKVYKIDKLGNIVKIYNSAKETVLEENISHKSLKYSNDNDIYRKGYKWKIIDHNSKLNKEELNEDDFFIQILNFEGEDYNYYISPSGKIINKYSKVIQTGKMNRILLRNKNTTKKVSIKKLINFYF